MFQTIFSGPVGERCHRVFMTYYKMKLKRNTSEEITYRLEKVNID